MRIAAMVVMAVVSACADPDPGPSGAPGEMGTAGERGPMGTPGIMGVAGPGLNWRGVYTSVASYAANDAVASAGSAYVCRAISCSGLTPPPAGDATWDLLARGGQDGAPGAIGPQGTIGATGPQGIQGMQGTIGPQGLQGAQGNVGPQGPIGMQGPAGSTGSQGPAGATGSQGLQGVQGVPGADGAPGTNGVDGAPGTNGQSVATTIELAGVNCPAGGVKLVGASGTSYVCNGRVPHQEQRWTSSATSFATFGAWITIPESAFTATTSGGDLLIHTNIQLVGGSHGTCRPIIDGVWAGTYGGYVVSPFDPYWTEGLQAVGVYDGGWHPWRVTRLYTAIPAGTHAFAMQCANNGGTMTSCDGNQVRGCSWGYIEL